MCFLALQFIALFASHKITKGQFFMKAMGVGPPGKNQIFYLQWGSTFTSGELNPLLMTRHVTITNCTINDCSYTEESVFEMSYYYA